MNITIGKSGDSAKGEIWLRILRLNALLLLLFAVAVFSQAPKQPDSLVNKALKLHYSLLTVDTHEDTPSKLQRFNVGEYHKYGKPGSGTVDLPRMKEGGLAASFFAVFTGQGPLTEEGREKARSSAMRTLDLLDKMFLENAGLCERALTPEDVRRIFKKGKRAIFIGMENGYPLGLNVSSVDTFFSRGVRYITLAHSSNNDLSSSSTEKKDSVDHGLSELGARVVRRMNDLGMLVDVSHISEKSFFDVLKVARAPVIASHSCARAMRDHPRNLSDGQLKALKKNGGVIQITFMGDYLKKISHIPEKEKEEAEIYRKVEAKGGWQALKDDESEIFWSELESIRSKYPQSYAQVKDVVDQIDYVVKTIGIEHVGIGTDFDGGGELLDCRDVTGMPNVTVELMRRSYSPKDIGKIWGENLLRVLGEAEALAAINKK